jgi:hypothetical protein
MPNVPWPPERSRWPAGFTPARDGWYRWYKGRTRYVCARSVPIAKIPDAWAAKLATIEEAEPVVALLQTHTYRTVLSEFLTECDARVQRRLRPYMEERTYENYQRELNAFGAFRFRGVAIADHPIDDIPPSAFTAYAARFGDWKASGFDSVVSRIGTLFNWAVEMEYLDRFRPGPRFQRPGKAAVRDDRIVLAKSFEPLEIAKLYWTGNQTMRCWIGLGAGAAFINTDVAHVPRPCIDLKSGLVDFRRRKTGKERRVIPLPQLVVDDLRAYQRPEPAEKRWADLFFLTQDGRPYFSCQSTVTRLFYELERDAMVKRVDGRNFTGLRTTFYNLAPRSMEYELERKIIMGRAKGTIDLDHYLEDLGVAKLKQVVDHVWLPISKSLQDEAARLASAAGDTGASSAAP